MKTKSKKYYLNLLLSSNIEFDEKALKPELIQLCKTYNLLKDETEVESESSEETTQTTEETTSSEETTQTDETIVESHEETTDESELIEQALRNAQQGNFNESNGVEESNGIVKIERKKRGKKESKPDSFRLEGYVLLMLVDTILPFAFSFIHNMMSKQIKIESNEIGLTDIQLKKVEPLADQCADYLSFNMNPVAGFFITTSLMYVNNLMALRSFKNAEIKR